MRKRLLARSVGALVLAMVGYRLGFALAHVFDHEPLFWWPWLTFAGALAGFFLTERLVLGPLERLVGNIREAPLSTVIVAFLGLLLGLIAAALLAVPLSSLPSPLGSWLPLGALLVSVWIGVSVMVARERQVIQLLRLPSGEHPHLRALGKPRERILLDTSAIIDGRIADIAVTGFLSAELIVPRFVLNELRHIADSRELARRARGRRGFEVPERLRRDKGMPLRMTDDAVTSEEVDSRLVNIAKVEHAAIMTTDYNLNRVAELQGIQVLNVNQLAQALKPVLLPGEEMTLYVVKEGREVGQGVAFLEDGTMLVVEDGRRFLGSEVGVEITRVLQTAGGRIVFAHPKAS